MEKTKTDSGQKLVTFMVLPVEQPRVQHNAEKLVMELQNGEIKMDTSGLQIRF